MTFRAFCFGFIVAILFVRFVIYFANNLDAAVLEDKEHLKMCLEKLQQCEDICYGGEQ